MNHELPTQEVEKEEHTELPAEDARIIFNREWVKAKEQRHQDNVRIFTGFLKGKYIIKGVGQAKREDNL